MKCELNPNIGNISGKCGNLLFKTYNKAGGKKETRLYFLPQKSVSPDGKKITYGYKRNAPVTEKQMAAMGKFKTFTQLVQRMSQETKMKYYEEWRAAKYKFNGKKYATLRGYIVARLYAESKDNQGDLAI